MFQINSTFCSGTLINNTANNEEQYFLTAHHCINSRENYISNVITYFNWQVATCASTTTPTYDSIVGAELVFMDEQTDVALLKITSTIPDSYDVSYAGWNRSETNNTNTTVIHHPSGDVKKISFDNDAPISSDTDWLADSLTTNALWEVVWDNGTTETGSSGSALFNQDYHIIGQLSVEQHHVQIKVQLITSES